MAGAFRGYELRTTDADAARVFYRAVAGLAPGESPAITVTALPQAALARGARPHWLGHLAVDGVDDATQRLLALGAQPLGPARRTDDGSSLVTLRDPFGAMLALRSTTDAPRTDAVAWHQLAVLDEARAWSVYADLFGWCEAGVVEHTGELSPVRTFAWEPGGQRVGGVASIARAPQVHPQWLYFFRVADLAAALDEVRARGGLALAPVRLASGDQLAACDDPQGAAFGLYERAPR